MKRALLPLFVLLLAGCRDLLEIDELTFDLGIGGQGGGGSGGEGGSVTGCEAMPDGDMPDAVLLHSTLDDLASVVTPLDGVGPGEVRGDASFVPALDGNGLEMLGAGDTATWPATDLTRYNVRLAQGTVDFCVRPAVDHDAGTPMVFFTLAAPGSTPLALVKESDGTLAFHWINDSPTNAERFAIAPEEYRMDADTWYRLTTTWSFPGGAVADVGIYLDGEALTPVLTGVGPVDAPGDPGGDMLLHLGSAEGVAGPGVIDELVIYNRPIPP